MRTSISLTTFPDTDPLADHLREVVEVADESGIDTVWIADHLLQADPASTPDAPMPEALTTLGLRGARTSRGEDDQHRARPGEEAGIIRARARALRGPRCRARRRDHARTAVGRRRDRDRRRRGRGVLTEVGESARPAAAAGRVTRRLVAAVLPTRLDHLHGRLPPRHPRPALGEDDEPPALQVVVHDVSRGVAVVEVRGDLDTMTATGFDGWVREQLGGRADVVLDLDGVAFLASAGIAALMGLRQDARAATGCGCT